jgi:uncharacterized protein YjbJ (UPF0337 family)
MPPAILEFDLRDVDVPVHHVALSREIDPPEHVDDLVAGQYLAGARRHQVDQPLLQTGSTRNLLPGEYDDD